MAINALAFRVMVQDNARVRDGVPRDGTWPTFYLFPPGPYPLTRSDIGTRSCRIELSSCESGIPGVPSEPRVTGRRYSAFGHPRSGWLPDPPSDYRWPIKTHRMHRLGNIVSTSRTRVLIVTLAVQLQSGRCESTPVSILATGIFRAGPSCSRTRDAVRDEMFGSSDGIETARLHIKRQSRPI
jgi:hypothetical protein